MEPQTVIRDMSDFDTDENLHGAAGVTHKITEGTSTVHQQYQRRLNAYRSQGVRILGAYHVLRTPGNNGNGSLSAQADFFLSHLDAQTPWWRDQPFILQIDAEKWPYDAVTGAVPVPIESARRALPEWSWAEIRAQRASTTIDFATLLLAENTHARVITYASRGQYGDALAGIPTDLWNAAYYDGSYPGDSAADWRVYSDRVPVLWQYASTPYDKSAYRGSAAELLNYVGGAMAAGDADAKAPFIDMRVEAIAQLYPQYQRVWTGQTAPFVVEFLKMRDNIAAIMAALGKPVQITLDDATRQAIVAGVVSAVSAGVELAPDALAHIEQAVHTELAKVQITVGA